MDLRFGGLWLWIFGLGSLVSGSLVLGFFGFGILALGSLFLGSEACGAGLSWLAGPRGGASQTEESNLH